MTSLRLATSLAFVFSLLLQPIWVAPAVSADAEKPAASLIKVDGDGDAKVRRKNGLEVRAGVPLSLSAGDKIITDAKSMVDLLLPDGSIIKVGVNSEYKIESADQKPGFISWVFQLTKGSVRALVEKSGDKKNVRLRVNTPAGTMGVRGTEFLVEHDEKSELTNLFTFHGLVEFGGKACEVGKACVMVGERMTSSIKKGDERPLPPRRFDAGSLLRQQSENANETAEKKREIARSRMALLGGLKESDKDPAKSNDAELDAMMKAAEERLQKAQNLFMGRDEALRKAMQAAKEAGTFEETMRLADKASALSGNSKNREALENTGVRQAKRFALGKAIAEKLADNKTSRREETSARLSAGESTSQALRLSGMSLEDLRRANQTLSRTSLQVAVQHEEVAAAMNELERMRRAEEARLAAERERETQVRTTELECAVGEALQTQEVRQELALEQYTIPATTTLPGTVGAITRTVTPITVQMTTTTAPRTSTYVQCDLRTGRACTSNGGSNNSGNRTSQQRRR